MDAAGSAGGVDLDPIAVAPDAGEFLEVAGAKALVAGIVPEEKRHGGERRGEDEFTDGAERCLLLFIPRFDFCAETEALEFAGVDGLVGIREDEGAANVGAAADGAELDVAFHFVVDPVKAFRGQGRAGGTDAAQVFETEIVAGRE